MVSCQIYKWPLIITPNIGKNSILLFSRVSSHLIIMFQEEVPAHSDSKKEIKQIACAVTNCKVVPWPLEMASKWRHQNYCHGCDFPCKLFYLKICCRSCLVSIVKNSSILHVPRSLAECRPTNEQP